MNVLVVTDFSNASCNAIRLGSWYAHKAEMPLRVLYVWDPSQHPLEDPQTSEALYAALEDFYSTSIWSSLAPAASEVGFGVLRGHVVETILKDADAHDTRLIVCGTSGRGQLQQTLFGSTASHLVRESTVPVMTVPAVLPIEAPTEILAPVDLSQCSWRSLEQALILGRDLGAKVHVIHALPPGGPYITPTSFDLATESFGTAVEQARAESRATIKAKITALGGDDLPVTVGLITDSPAHAILEAAKERATRLVVMGTHGRRGVERFFLGSTAERVLRSCTSAVLTVRERVMRETDAA